MINELKTQLITAIAQCPVVYIPHFHYALVDNVLKDVLCPEEGKRKLFSLEADDIIEFDLNRGIIDFASKNAKKNLSSLSKLETYLDSLVEWRDFDHERIFIFKNIASVWENPNIQSYLQSFADKYERGCYDKLCTIVLVSSEPSSELPPQLEKITTVIEISAPNEAEIRAEVGSYPVSMEYDDESEREDVRTEMCRTLQGLQLYEMQQILKLSTMRTAGRISRPTIRIASEEKKQIVKKSGIVEVVDADVNFDEVGGLDKLREYIDQQEKIFNNLNLAIRCNIPMPKGILIIGMPGCGKSMIAKSVASKFNMTLLRLDVNRLMGKYVGQSESNLRKALATAEAAHPCVLWIDEIEKAFAGSNNSSGDNDMLVMRLMGHFLTWMQERKTPVYIVATANDAMRPEFMRKGRFDEVFFVNFPNKDERKDIFTKKIERYKQAKEQVFDFSGLTSYDTIAEKMSVGQYGFAGAEVESLIQQVMSTYFMEYVEALKDNKKKPIKIIEKKFLDEIERMKETVMSKQIRPKDKRHGDKTSIERILEMDELYHFTEASNNKKDKKS